MFSIAKGLNGFSSIVRSPELFFDSPIEYLRESAHYLKLNAIHFLLVLHDKDITDVELIIMSSKKHIVTKDYQTICKFDYYQRKTVSCRK